MADRTTPEQLSEAIQRIWSDLPRLVGETSWSEVEPQLKRHLEVLRNEGVAEGDTLQASIDIVDCLASHPGARRRLRSELSRQELRDTLADTSGLDETALEYFHIEARGEATRRVVINPDGTGGGASRKLTNIRIDPRRLLDILTDGVSGVIAAYTGSKLAIITSVLSVIRSVNKAITIDISEKDARVFSALVLAGANAAAIPETALLQSANDRRHSLGLAPLSPEELRSSLYTLEQIHSIARDPDKTDHWSIVESFRVRG